MNYYDCMDRIYLQYCFCKKSKYKLGLKIDKDLIESLLKDIKYVISKGSSVDTLKSYLEVIFSGNEKLLKEKLKDIY
jgi:hypothetical protein